jgi:hypothetical protein
MCHHGNNLVNYSLRILWPTNGNRWKSIFICKARWGTWSSIRIITSRFLPDNLWKLVWKGYVQVRLIPLWRLLEPLLNSSCLCWWSYLYWYFRWLILQLLHFYDSWNLLHRFLQFWVQKRLRWWMHECWSFWIWFCQWKFWRLMHGIQASRASRLGFDWSSKWIRRCFGRIR